LFFPTGCVSWRLTTTTDISTADYLACQRLQMES